MTEETSNLMRRLAAPFDWKEIKFKPQSVNYSDDSAQAAAYADNRAYYERLDDVMGADGWSVTFNDPVVGEYLKLIKGKKAWGDKPATEDQFIKGFKVMVVCEVHLYGPDHYSLGTKSSTGSADVSDENDITTAEAQAFKRACSAWGIGRYLYHLGAMTCPYDTKKRKWKTSPMLPDWAIPYVPCQDCKAEILEYHYSQKGHDKVLSKAYVLYKGFERYKLELCGECQKKRNTQVQEEGGRFQ